jgi:hypothetical protein
MINQKPNKKRERNAPLFKTCVSINTNGNLIIDHEWASPKKIIENLGDIEYKYTIASIVKHCMSESVTFDERLNKLLKNI